MKDIDFDELDRAVNSLMQPTPANDDTPAVAPTASTSVVSGASDELQLEAGSDFLLSAESEIEAPELTIPPEPPKVVASVVPATPATPPTPRGRFMDVVRPGVKGPSQPAASPAVSRQGVTLKPVMPWSSQPAALTMANQVSVSTFEPNAPAMPFLHDAKVEKRPLGRPLDAPATPELSEEPVAMPQAPTMSATPTVSTPEIAAPASAPSSEEDAQLPEQPLPAELGSELLSIESKADTVFQPQTPRITPEVPVQPAPQTFAAPEATRSIANASIPQQYKIEPKEDTEPASAIYDVGAYQPLSHPAKKKPGWLWVIAIIVILLIGTGAGAAFYYFNLI